MIRLVNCDIFKADVDVVCHQVNCMGAMNSGIAKQVRALFPSVYDEYKTFCKKQNIASLLGKVQSVSVIDKIICNLFSQKKYGYDGEKYTDYEALKNCFQELKRLHGNKRMAIPYLMSCDRGGGDWRTVEEMILDTLGDCDVIICRHKGGK